MIISVINHTNGKISDEQIQTTLRAINRQIREDFEPYWSLGAQLRLEGKSTLKPDKIRLPDMRGDAVLYLWDEVDVDDALGYHEQNNRGIPFGIVFTELSRQLGESWTATLSHEALELIRSALKGSRAQLKWHDPDATFAEGIASRGDRRIGRVI